MSAFTPSLPVFPRPIHTQSSYRTPLCTLTRGGRAGRRRLHSYTLDDNRLVSALPASFLQEVRRLIRGTLSCNCPLRLRVAHISIPGD